jgi:hypothetical protein
VRKKNEKSPGKKTDFAVFNTGAKIWFSVKKVA